MENFEIMENEQVMDTTEEIVEATSSSAVKFALGTGLAALAGFGIYKWVKHIRNKKNAGVDDAKRVKSVYEPDVIPGEAVEVK